MSISAYVISAICGNWWQESTLNPSIWQGLSQATFTSLNAGYGLGQWTNTGGDIHGRLYKLYKWITDNGKYIDDGNAQIDYFIEENVWYSREEASSFSNLSAFLNSTSTDIEFLTHAFNRGWEGIHDSTWDVRVTYARNCYQYIQEYYNDTSITEWKKGNRYLSTNERLNNAVMVYRKLNGIVPPTPTKKHKMPLYMMLRQY